MQSLFTHLRVTPNLYDYLIFYGAQRETEECWQPINIGPLCFPLEKNTSFMFSRRNQAIEVWNDMRAIK